MANTRLERAVASISKAIQNAPPAGVDPIVLARETGLGEVDVMAGLGVLLQRGLGAFAVQVLNARGQAIGEFPSIEDTPEAVVDAYGDEVEVEPRNTRIIFRPTVAA